MEISSTGMFGFQLTNLKQTSKSQKANKQGNLVGWIEVTMLMGDHSEKVFQNIYDFD